MKIRLRWDEDRGRKLSLAGGRALQLGRMDFIAACDLVETFGLNEQGQWLSKQEANAILAEADMGALVEALKGLMQEAKSDAIPPENTSSSTLPRLEAEQVPSG